MTRVFTIPAGHAFLDALARGVVERWHDPDDPFALARVTLLLPTRRAVRSARDAFRTHAEQLTGAPLLLPRIQPIGDVDEDDLLVTSEANAATDATLPPAIPDLRRQIVLARLIERWQAARAAGTDRRIAPGQAVRLAKDLGAFLDLVQTEDVDLAALEHLAPERFADHWQHTLTFLSILTEAWPGILADQGVMDRQVRRSALIDALRARWESAPPTTPIIAAGSTGSVPATARLLKTVAGLPEGTVILPGLDTDSSPEVWDRLEDSHPQFGLRQLLIALDLSPDQVLIWPGAAVEPVRTRRVRLLNESLRPAGTTDDWMDILAEIAPPEAVADLFRIDAPTTADEARAIALVMRETLETPGRTAALVTPDRALARRVRQELRRWDVDVDDSAGEPLADTPPAMFLRLIAHALRARFMPVALLGLLKHPLFRAGLSADRLSFRIAKLETKVLRDLRPRPGLEGLAQAIVRRARDQDGAPLTWTGDAIDLVDRLREAFRPLTALADGESHGLQDWARAHAAVAETLADAGKEGPGTERVWLGDAGDALAGLMADMAGEGHHGSAIALTDYPALFDSLIDGRVVRSPRPRHPRLFIWGPLEARLQQTDVTILGGLNEGTWPADPGLDPWLSRPMRRELTLPSPERRIGQAAHDFAQLAAGETVYLTRAEKTDGAPQVASRWLLRLDNLLQGAGHNKPLAPTTDYLALAALLDRPDRVARTGEPRPCPPMAARPTRLSVTEIETLIRDPYAIYARHVLGLRALDPLERPPGPRERGTAIHAALERFLEQTRAGLPHDALDRLLALGREELEELLDEPALRRFWWPRFERAARYFLETEEAWREKATPGPLEQKGEWTPPLPFAFTLSGRADRIDHLTFGGYALIDYKTGTPPTGKQVGSGLAPQLTLSAVMVEADAFDGLEPAPVHVLRYIQVKGAREPDTVADMTKTPDETRTLIAQTRDGVMNLLKDYADPNTPYRSRPLVQFDYFDGDYDHLARVKEWSVDMAEDEA